MTCSAVKRPSRSLKMSDSSTMPEADQRSGGNSPGSIARGNRQETAGDPGLYTSNFDLSPDGTRIAVAQRNPENSRYDVQVIDWARKTPTRFTFDPALGPNGNVVWSPDGASHRVFVRAPREPGHLRTQREGTAWKQPFSPRQTTNGPKTGPRTGAIWPMGSIRERPHLAISMLFRCSETGSPFWYLNRPSLKTSRDSRSMANGWPTTRTNRAPCRCTSCRFRRSIKSGRSRAWAACNRDGGVMARSSTISALMAP